jgi:hypothetical protein
MPEVARAIEQVVGECGGEYARFENPYYVHDARGIVLLRRRDARV